MSASAPKPPCPQSPAAHGSASRARIFAFSDLSPEMQRAAVEKISRLAVLRAEYNGELWAESSRDLAQTARFEIYRVRGQIAGIWSVRFAREPLVVAGTEFKRPNGEHSNTPTPRP